MYILKRILFSINENKKETDEYLKTLVNLTDEQEADIKTIYDKLHATPYLINFIKYYTEQDINIDNISKVIQWLKGTKQYKLLPNNIDYYKNFEKLQDDIREIQDYSDIKKLYDYLKMDKRNCSFDEFKKIARSFLELDKSKRNQFTPLKYFRININITAKQIIDAIQSFIEGLIDPEYEKNTREKIQNYVKKGLVHVIYDKQEENNNKLVVSINTEKKTEELFKDLTTDKWCINYSYEQYKNNYLVPTNSFLLIHDFDMPNVMDNSMFGIVFNSDGTPRGSGGCQNKNNIYTSIEDISKLTNIPIEYIALSDFDKNRIKYYLEHFTEYFEKEAIKTGATKIEDVGDNSKIISYMFPELELAKNFLKSFGLGDFSLNLMTTNKKIIDFEKSIEYPYATYVVDLYKNTDSPSSVIFLRNPSDDNLPVLKNKKEAYDKHINMYERLTHDFETPYDFMDHYKIFIENVENTTTLTYHGILSFIEKNNLVDGLINQIIVNISKIIEIGSIQEEYKHDFLLFFSTSNKRFTYEIHSLLKYYVQQGLTLENFTKFVTGYKFILENVNKNIRTGSLYYKIPFLFYKNNILTQSVEVFCRILPQYSGEYINEIIDDLFIQNCGKKIDGVDIFTTFTEWLSNFNKINEILEKYNRDTYNIDDYITDDIDIIKAYLSDSVYIEYFKENDMDVYDIYAKIKENDADDIEKFIDIFNNNIIQPKDDIDYALLYKNGITEYNDIFFKSISDGELEGEYYIKYNSLQEAADDVFDTSDSKVKLEDADFFDNSYDMDWTSYDDKLSDRILYFMYYYFIKKGFIFSKKYTPKMLTDRSIWRELNSQISDIIKGDYESDKSEELYNDFDYEEFQNDLGRILINCQRSADESKYYNKNVEKFTEVFDKFNDGQYFKLIEEEKDYYDYDKAIKNGSSVQVKNLGYVKIIKASYDDDNMTISKDGVEHIVPRKVMKERTIFNISESFIKKILNYNDVFSEIVNQSGNDFNYSTLLALFKDGEGGLEPFNGDYYGNIDGDYDEDDFADVFLNHYFEGDIISYWADFDKKYSKLFK